jgi:hypothetical protein
MAKAPKAGGSTKAVLNLSRRKGIKMSTMNKRKRANFKKYRGQGKP